MAQPTCAGLTMKMHTRASWKSAAIVASPDMTFKAREPAAPSSSGIIGRRQKNQATNAAMPTATMTAASVDPIRPMAAANAKIPKAQPSDNAISAPGRRAVAVPAGSVVWVAICTLSKASTCELVFVWEPTYGIQPLYLTHGLPVYFRSQNENRSRGGKIQMLESSP